MSQRGVGFRGKFKGRGRQSPYSRGGSGGGYRRFQKPDAEDGGGKQKPFSKTDSGETPDVSAVGSDESQPPIPLLSIDQAKTPLQRDTMPPISSTPDRTTTHPSTALASDAVAKSGGKEKKYSVKARLFVGNLPRDTSHDMVKRMFSEFGEVKEVFVQKEKNFGFVRMVSRFGVVSKGGCPLCGVCPQKCGFSKNLKQVYYKLN